MNAILTSIILRYFGIMAILFFLLEIILRINFLWTDFPIYQYKIQEKQVHCYDDSVEAIRLCPEVNAVINHPLGFNFQLSTDNSGERITANNPKIEQFQKDSLWIIGDSLSMGWGIHDVDTFSYLLSQKGWAIRNLSSDSLGSIAIKNILNKNLNLDSSYNKKMPSKIIWMFSRSDFVDDVSSKAKKEIFYIGKYLRSSLLIRSILEKRKFLKDANDYIGNNLEDFHEPVSSHPTLIAIDELNQISKKFDIPIIIVLAPDWKYPNGPPNYNSEYLKYIDKKFHEMGFSVLNVSNKYKSIDDQEFYIMDDGHPNARAHSIIADELNAYLHSHPNIKI